ncbi:hypothetical protein, partial [uncultured Desulfovibrio sp.]|uniref:hypothetical protein n=1 Tax=uncultured Desulfovibrio sp. TaxID=167968 RepID=UPI00262D92A3
MQTGQPSKKAALFIYAFGKNLFSTHVGPDGAVPPPRVSPFSKVKRSFPRNRGTTANGKAPAPPFPYSVQNKSFREGDG